MFASALTHNRTMSECSDGVGSQDVTGQQQAAISAAPTNQASAIGAGCGCDHCVGTEIIIAQVAPVERVMPPPLNAIAQFPALVTREPAVPPPELLVAV